MKCILLVGQGGKFIWGVEKRHVFAPFSDVNPSDPHQCNELSTTYTQQTTMNLFFHSKAEPLSFDHRQSLPSPSSVSRCFLPVAIIKLRNESGFCCLDMDLSWLRGDDVLRFTCDEGRYGICGRSTLSRASLVDINYNIINN